MKITIICSLVLAFILSASSCRRNLANNEQLSRTEQLMSEHPDSSLTLLNEIDSSRLSAKQHADWCLLITQARDKNYIEHSSDSLIRIAINYYEEHPEPERLMLSYYVAGRVSQELGSAPRAQEYYLKALKTDEIIENFPLKARICSNLGMLYTYQNAYDLALSYLKRSESYLIKTNDSISLSYVLRDIGRTYMVLEQSDSAVFYYRKALESSLDSTCPSILSELGGALSDSNEYTEALSYLKASLQANTNAAKYHPTYLSLGKLYLSMNEQDSAYYYLNKSLASSNIRTKAGGLYYLTKLTKLQGDLKTALAMQEEYEILRDSIQQQTYTETIQQQQALYNYQQIEEEAATYKLRHMTSQRNNYLLLLLLGFVVLIVTLSLFVQLNYKKKKEKQLEQERRLQNQQHRSSLSEKEKFISQLEDTFSSEKEGMNIKLLMLERRIVDIQKRKASLLAVKGQYAESIPFWDSIRKGQKLTDDEWQIIATWMDLNYSNFTQRLRELYPLISEEELHICYLVKIAVSVKRISEILSKTSQAISVARKRLYQKLTKKEGSAEKFDSFIADF